ncbi:MAG: sigma-70 family RNA polymerase sigma factor [Bacteroidales bacterium]|nr:sigma-70 family RNA polymerase sigma factor [Bacteroidales bacterium]
MSGPDIDKRIRYLALLRIFQQHIANFCNAHSDSLAEAEDLMQEVFAYLWEKIDQLRPDSTLQQQNRWLHRVMVTTLVRHLRHHPFRHRVSLAAASRLAADEDSSAELLDDILSVLPPADRQLIDARLQGYSYAEIAETVHSTPEAVKQRVYRIMKTLRKYKP